MGRWHYPRWRRVLMQGVLCAIFAASVGIAHLVTRHRMQAGITHLAGIRWFGRVGVKAPAGWSLEAENQGPILLVAQEPDEVDPVDRQGRRLTVRRHQLDTTLSADEYLKSSGLLRGTRPLPTQDQDEDLSQSINIAGTAGIVRTVVRPRGIAIFTTPTYETEWIACVIRPNGLALTLQLESPDNNDLEADWQLLQNIASSIEVRDPVSKE